MSRTGKLVVQIGSICLRSPTILMRSTVCADANPLAPATDASTAAAYAKRFQYLRPDIVTSLLGFSFARARAGLTPGGFGVDTRRPLTDEHVAAWKEMCVDRQDRAAEKRRILAELA